MGLSLRGQTSGAIDINAPAVAGNNTITLPNGNGSANQFYKNSTTAGNVTHSSMVELANGQIGIGTTAPNQLLELSSADPVIRFSRPGNINAIDSTLGKIEFYNNDTSADGPTLSASIQAFTASTTGAGGYLTFSVENNGINSALAEAMRIDRLGNVGIGVTSIGNIANRSQVAIGGSSGGLMDFLYGSTTEGRIFVNDSELVIRASESDGDIIFQSGGNTERMRLDSSGNFGIGTTTPDSELSIGNGNANNRIDLSDERAYFGYDTSYGAAGALYLDGGGGFNKDIILQPVSTGNVGIGTTLPSKALDVNSGTVDTVAVFTSEDTTARIIIRDSGSTVGGYLSVTGDDMTLVTNAIGRIVVKSSGEVLIPGTYSNTTASGVNVNVHTDGNLRRSTSSGKYKTSVEEIDISYSEALLNCRPVWYRSTCEADDPDYSWWGFIAEEVAEIDPRLVHWKTAEVTYDEKGSIVETPCEPEAEGVAYDRFVPHLLNLIKRQQSAIETLETQNASLEARLTTLEGN